MAKTKTNTKTRAERAEARAQKASANALIQQIFLYNQKARADERTAVLEATFERIRDRGLAKCPDAMAELLARRTATRAWASVDSSTRKAIASHIVFGSANTEDIEALVRAELYKYPGFYRRLM